MFLTAKKKHKYFIGHRDDYKIRALYILFPKMRECEKNFARDLHMSFLIDDDKLLEKYNKSGIKLAIVLKIFLIMNLRTFILMNPIKRFLRKNCKMKKTL